MEVILNNLYDREFFENGGIIKTKKDEVINDCKTFIKLKITSDDIETAKIGNKDYIYDDKEQQFYYSDMRNFLEPKDAYGIKNVNFSLIDRDDSRWEEFKKERLENGFDESETWALDSTIAKFILPRLKCFYNDGDILSYPGNLTSKEWSEIVYKMVKAFDLIVNVDVAKRTEEEVKAVEEGLDLFREYFFDLWN